MLLLGEGIVLRACHIERLLMHHQNLSLVVMLVFSGLDTLDSATVCMLALRVVVRTNVNLRMMRIEAA